jgi:pimeloyl-ACP methyl ester carboxylesterase
VGPHELEAAFFEPAAVPGAAASAGLPTLVFLHEGLGSVSLWRDFPQRAAEATGLRAFAYSRRGYGQSSGYPPPWHERYMHDEARLLPAVLAAAGIGPHILVGHSDGASISILYAGDESADAAAARAGLRGLVLMAPHTFAEEFGLRSIAQIREAYLASGELKARLSRHHRDPDNAFWGWNTGWLNPAFRAWNIDSSLPRVRVPALVVQGEADEYGTLQHVRAIEQHSSGPVELLLLPRSGHSPWKDAPDAVLAAIARFTNMILPC